jgi:hypothetical protein
MFMTETLTQLENGRKPWDDDHENLMDQNFWIRLRINQESARTDQRNLQKHNSGALQLHACYHGGCN